MHSFQLDLLHVLHFHREVARGELDLVVGLGVVHEEAAGAEVLLDGLELLVAPACIRNGKLFCHWPIDINNPLFFFFLSFFLPFFHSFMFDLA